MPGLSRRFKGVGQKRPRLRARNEGAVWQIAAIGKSLRRGEQALFLRDNE